MKDTLFKSGAVPGSFRFDEKVAGVFDDMLSRSIPHYEEVQAMVAELAADYALPKTKIYDLGCSTATTLIGVAGRLNDDSIRLTGVDASAPILKKAKEKIVTAGLKEKIELVRSDIMDAPLEKAGVVIMNYTLQFIPPENRPKLLGRIFNALEEGGALLLSEKVTEDDPELSERFVGKYHDFKREMGYSELEISAKREALDKVLVPLSVESEMALLKEAGFKKTAIFFKWFNFASFLAVK